MRINELRLQNLRVGTEYQTNLKPNTSSDTNIAPKDSPFAKELQSQIEKNGGVSFSKHAMQRIESRDINLDEADTLNRLNKAVEIAQEKGSNETLIIVDSTAFVVNVKNNKVITTMGRQDMIGNIFTNIDSTVII